MAKQSAGPSRRRAFGPGPEEGLLPEAPERWPAKPKTIGRKPKKIRVSANEAADALERRR